MKAVIWKKYGSPEGLEYGELETPIPENDEIRIRIAAATVTAGDCEVRSLKIPFLLRLPMRIFIGFSSPKRVRVLGQEVAGVVDQVGADVEGFQVGDQVFGSTGLKMGAYAEYVCLRPSEEAPLRKVPAGLSFDEAAAIPTGGLEALYFLQLANIRAGDSVLINGAGGSIGSFGVQLAKHYGAEVTAVDHGDKLEMLRSLGADHVVDYTREDFTRGGRTFDVIFDVIGKSTYFGSLRSLNPGGRYVIANPQMSHFLGRMFPRSGGRRVITGAAEYSRKALNAVTEWVQDGRIKIVIDRRFPLAQTAEAHRYVETGQKQGNVVITVSE